MEMRQQCPRMKQFFIHSTHCFASRLYPANDIVDCVVVNGATAARDTLFDVCGAQNRPFGGVAGPGVAGVDTEGVLTCERLCTRCARTKCPAASAERSESSPAMTDAATIRASC